MATIIDISHWRKVNWQELDPRIDGVIIKATESDDWTDPSFESHIEGALGEGLLVGVYHFYRTIINKRKVKPKTQAAHFLNVIKPYKFDIQIISLDWERSHLFSNGEWYNKPTGTANNDFYNFFEGLEIDDYYEKIIKLAYCNLATWQHWRMENWQNVWQGPAWLKDRPDIQLWIAYWTEEAGRTGRLPRPFKEYFMHQYSATRQYVNGVYSSQGKPCPVDMNSVNVSIELLEYYLKRFRTGITKKRLIEFDHSLSTFKIGKPEETRMAR